MNFQVSELFKVRQEPCSKRHHQLLEDLHNDPVAVEIIELTVEYMTKLFDTAFDKGCEQMLKSATTYLLDPDKLHVPTLMGITGLSRVETALCCAEALTRYGEIVKQREIDAQREMEMELVDE